MKYIKKYKLFEKKAIDLLNLSNQNLRELPEDLDGYWKWYYNKYPEMLAAKKYNL